MRLPKEILINNPLDRDFSIQWLDDENVAHTLALRSREALYFPRVQGEFLAKHLSDAVYNSRKAKSNTSEQYAEIMKEIKL